MAMETCYGCDTVQNFCSTCQKGSELLSSSVLNITDTDGFKQYDVITTELWNKTYIILDKLYKKGDKGNRNFPSLEKVNNFKDFESTNKYEQITNDLYIKLLKDISLDADGNQLTLPELKKNQEIKIDDVVNKVQNFLENYKIDFNRCNNCNATSNCSHCAHCYHTYVRATPIFCFQGCGNSCDHGGSCSQCCMYGSPGSTPKGGDSSCP